MPKVCVLSLLALACGSSAFAQGAANNHQLRYTQAHGMTFSEIGDPGFPGTFGNVPGQAPNVFDSFGAVNHRYRISTTEVTSAQYFEFAQAVAPHIVALGGDGISLSGRSLVYLGTPGGVPQYELPKEFANTPARANYGYFALMANWLHNGAPSVTDATIDTFRTGAYDDPVGQATRNEGAQFWIPSRDEWMKAVYYDPNRNGPGQGGYWLYPDASDDPLIPGLPEKGGETSAGNFDEWPPPDGYPNGGVGNGRPNGVGLYPDVQTPWGLLDASGSASEWTETIGSQSIPNRRYIEGTAAAFNLEPGSSVLGDYLFTPSIATGSLFGRSSISVRFAAAIPSPGAGVVVVLSAIYAARRRR